MLVEQMKVLLASVFSLYLKTHNFHWNITGPNFPQYHDFLGNLYNEIHESVDKIAEEIRALDSYAPGSYMRFQELTKIEDETSVPSALTMINILYFDNQRIIDQLTACHTLAQEQNIGGLINFLEDRLDIHSKHAWKLRSIFKT